MTYGVGVGDHLHAVDGLDLRLRLRLELGRGDGGLGLGRLSVVGPGRLGLLLPVSVLPAGVLGRRRAWGPWGGGAVWGPGGWAATTGNIYSRWGATSAVTRALGRLQRLDRERLAQLGRHVLQLAHRQPRRGPAIGAWATSTPATTHMGAAADRHQPGHRADGQRRPRDRRQHLQRKPGDGRPHLGHDGLGSAALRLVRGEQGGVARVGDDVYAGKDGNVYKRKARAAGGSSSPAATGTAYRTAGRPERSTASSARARTAARPARRATTTRARAATDRAIGRRWRWR